MRLGDVVGGRFEVEERVGSGGMGEVHRARDRETGSRVAVKTLVDASDAIVERFLREARVLSELHHPAIVRYVAHGRADGVGAYLVMEWLEGEDLAQRLSRGPLSVEDTMALVARVCSALSVVHERGIVHRDIKPANLFLPASAIREVKLLDFGIARLDSSTRTRTAAGAMLGTVGYMAPEQARGETTITPATDVFSLGCVAFECAAGRAAFPGDSAVAVLAKLLFDEPPPLRSIRRDVSASLESLVARMLAKNPAQRPVNAAAVIASVDDAVPPTEAHAQTIGAQEMRLVSVVVTAPAVVHPLEETALDAPPQGFDSTGVHLVRVLDGSHVGVIEDASGVATDQARTAARCALALRASMPSTSIAIATGRAVVVGGSPIGEVIDRAAELLRAPGDSSIRVDEVTAGLLGERFETSTEAGVRLLAREREDVARTVLGRSTPFVGRDRELGILRATFDECVGDSIARAALVISPPGLGKSRVVREFVASNDGEVWHADGDPMRSGTPYGALSRALRVAAGVPQGAAIDAQREHVRAFVARFVRGDEAARVSEFLGEALGVPFSDEDSVQLKAARDDASLMGDQIRRALDDIARAASARPLVLVLEDLHWCDVQTVRWVDALLRTLRDAPLFVLATARPEVRDRFPSLWKDRGAIEIALTELSPRAAERLARRVLGDRAADDAVKRLVERAGGNPLYLEELLRAESEGRADAPPTVLAMLHARLESVAPEQRRLLRTASVLGEVFWQEPVEGLLGRDASTLLADAREHEWIVRSNDSRIAGQIEWRFRHALIRDAAYAMLTDGDRKLAHAFAGRWLESHGEPDAEALAVHYRRGGRDEDAIRCYIVAAREALARAAWTEALARAASGVQCGASGESLATLRTIQADAASTLPDQHARGGAWAAEAMSLLTPGSPEWFDAANWAVLCFGRSGDNEALRRVAEQVESVEPAGAAREVGLAALSFLGWWSHQTGDYARFDRIARRVESSVPSSLDLPRARIGINRVLDFLAAERGDEEDRLVCAKQALELATSLGDRRRAMVERSNISSAQRQHGRYELGEPDARRALDEAIAIGASDTMPRANLVSILSRLGRFEEARKECDRALADARARKDPRSLLVVFDYDVWLRFAMGDDEGVVRVATEALANASDYRTIEAEIRTVLARALLRLGRFEDALREAERAYEVLGARWDVMLGSPPCALAYAQALAATGRHDRAREVITSMRDEIVRRIERGRDPEFKRAFAERIEEHARILELASKDPRDWEAPRAG